MPHTDQRPTTHELHTAEPGLQPIARARPRHVLQALVTSTFVAALSVGGLWLLSDRPASGQAQATVPGFPSADSQDILRGPKWRLEHLGPDSVQKCSAYRRIWARRRQLQPTGGGAPPPTALESLESALNAANRMTPRWVTPGDCGVPL